MVSSRVADRVNSDQEVIRGSAVAIAPRAGEDRHAIPSDRRVQSEVAFRSAQRFQRMHSTPDTLALADQSFLVSVREQIRGELLFEVAGDRVR